MHQWQSHVFCPPNAREPIGKAAEKILEDEIVRYLNIQRGKEIAPIITALRDHGDALRHEVLEQARRRQAKGTNNEDLLEYVTASLLKKLLHNPSVRLRKAGEVSDQDVIDIARELFGLDNKD